MAMNVRATSVIYDIVVLFADNLPVPVRFSSIRSSHDATKKAYVYRIDRYVSPGLWPERGLSLMLHDPSLPAGVLNVVPEYGLGKIHGSSALFKLEVLAAKPAICHMTLL